MSSLIQKRAFGLTIISPLLLAVTLFAASGCFIEDGYYEDDGYYYDDVYLADLQVDWSIQGADSASLCSVYGINRWIVEAHGPESRTTELDCSKYFWSTENDFAAMSEGSYIVTVQAVDHLGYIVASRSTSTSLYDVGQLQTLHVDFRPSDFSF